MKWEIEEIICAVNGSLFIEGRNKSFGSIVIDSRNVSLGCLFVSINGKNHKGINFLDEIIKKGASGIILGHNDLRALDIIKVKRNNITCILVNDTIYALGELASFHRKRINAKVIAVTGSVGKTTTRRMISRILTEKYSIKSTTGNMNNCIGLPLTLLEAKKYNEVIVLELGMNAIGEIKRLSQICQPNFGVVINVAETHLATLGNIKNIAKAKSEIIEYIKPTGSLILNNDDYLVRKMSQITSLKVVLFGTRKESNVRARKIKLTEKESSFLLVTPIGATKIFLSIPSKALVMDALAASTVANLLGCSNNEIKVGIESFFPNFGRMNIINTKVLGLRIIDDTYNSSPLSMKNILETVAAIREHKTVLAVIGDMSELGEKSELMHIEAGKLIAECGVDQLYATGYFANKLVEGTFLAKKTINKIYVGSKKDIIKNIKYSLRENTLVLIKGSRNMEMETVLMEIKKIINNT